MEGIDSAKGPLFVCTIEAEYPQLIGACMQFVSMQALQPQPEFLLRIVRGAGAEHELLLAMARMAGISVTCIQRHARNRFANKWAALETGLTPNGKVVLVDWDVLNTGASEFPETPAGKISARTNPADLYGAFASRARPLSPGCWDESKLPASINSGVVAGQRESMLRLGRRILELEARLRVALPDAADWQLEKLAASMSAGEVGLAPLPPEWNVTPSSEISDERVLFWHYNSGHATTRDLKLILHRPEETESHLATLGAAWPLQTERFRGHYDRALQLLRLDRLLPPRGRASRVEKRNQKTEPLPADRTLLAACSSGLCNRLLMLAGALRLAGQTRRRLRLYWPNNAEVGCDFSDLFENDLPLFGERDLHDLLNATVTVQIYNAWRMPGPLFPDIAPDGDPQAEIVLIKGWYYPKFSHEEYNGRFFRSAREQLLSLRPRQSLVERADRFDLPHVAVGVHLRRGDACPEFQVSRDEHFQTIMSALAREFPGLKFFLATDDALTSAKFCERFGDAILQLPKNGGGRKRREGMEEALIDLLLLSRTRAIIGNNFSTFSHTAGAFGGIPVVVAKEETAVLDLSSTLEICRAALAR